MTANFLITLSLLAFFNLPQVALASPARDAILGRYNGVQPDGRACYLHISDVAGKTEIEFTDFMSSRKIRDAGAELEAQLAKRAPMLVFKTRRRSLGDVTIYLEVLRDSRSGKPRSMRGTVEGWLRTEANCRFR